LCVFLISEVASRIYGFKAAFSEVRELVLDDMMHLVALELLTASIMGDCCKIDLSSSFLFPIVDPPRSGVVSKLPRLSEFSEPTFDRNEATSWDLAMSEGLALERQGREDVLEVVLNCASLGKS
jgi:hypothetical protein